MESLLIPGMLLLWSSRRDLQLPCMFEVFLVLLVTIVGLFRIFPPLQKQKMKLTMKGVPFVWTDDCQVSSYTLKEKLMSAPILVLAKSGKRFTMYTDASRVSLGCVLM